MKAASRRSDSSAARRTVLTWVTLGVSLVTAPSLRADDYSDFQIPAHRQTDWSLSLGGSGARSRSSFNAFFDHVASHRSAVNATTFTRFEWLSDSDPALTRISAEGAISGERRWDSGDGLYDRSPVEILAIQDARATRNLLESWALSATQRLYPWALPLGFTATVSGTGNYTQSWFHAERWSLDALSGLVTETRERARSTSWRYEHTLGVSAGFGFGRVRDATAVYEAEVLERRLRATGALARPLSAAARQRLAAVFYLRALGSLRDRPGRALWKEIERILADDGALGPQGIDPYAVLRSAEPLYGGSIARDGLPSSPIGRPRGFFAGPLLSEIHLHRRVHGTSSQFYQDIVNDTLGPAQDFSTGFAATSKFDRLLVGGRAEIHRPVGSRWQLDASTQATVPLRRGDEGFDFASTASATWLVADRWLAIGSLQHQRSVHRSIVSGVEVTDWDNWQWGYAISGNYYLEDRLSLQLSLQGSQGHSRGFQSLSSGSITSIQLSLGYQILGRYVAPGTLGTVPLGADD